MNSDPLSEPDETPPPPRKDADAEKIGGDAGEKDLWDFSSDGEMKPYQPAGKKGPEVRRGNDEASPGVIPPAPRQNRRDFMTFTQNVSKKAPLEKRSAESGPDADPSDPTAPIAKTSPLKVESAFDDLDTPVEAVAKSDRAPRSGKGREDKGRKSEPKSAPVEEPEVPEIEPGIEPEITPEPEIVPAAKIDEKTVPTLEPVISEEAVAVTSDVSTPEPAPATDRKPLSFIERGCLIAFAALLLAGAFFLFHSLHKLPEKPKELTASDFPIKGTKLEAVKVDSYWRAPITEGATVDTFRRGTVLLPVLDLRVTGGPAAVRVFFRNSAGELVGDPVTRPVASSTTLKIAASAGFDDLGMHAAYRAGDAKPWKVEILEGPSVGAPGDQFKKLFEIPISTERR